MLGKQNPPTSDLTRCAYVPVSCGIVGALGSIFSLSVTGFGIINDDSSICIIFVIMFFFSVLLMLSSVNRKIEYNDNTITYTSLLGKKTQCLLSDFICVRYSVNGYTILFRSGKSIDAGNGLIGSGELLAFLKARVTEENTTSGTVKANATEPVTRIVCAIICGAGAALSFISGEAIVTAVFLLLTVGCAAMTIASFTKKLEYSGDKLTYTSSSGKSFNTSVSSVKDAHNAENADYVVFEYEDFTIRFDIRANGLREFADHAERLCGLENDPHSPFKRIDYTDD